MRSRLPLGRLAAQLNVHRELLDRDLAYVAASVLGMIPITPGGLGFVEAGLTGTLVLAGVDAGAAAVATLAYRLVSFWLPLPAGAVAYRLFSRRLKPVPLPVPPEVPQQPQG